MDRNKIKNFFKNIWEWVVVILLFISGYFIWSYFFKKSEVEKNVLEQVVEDINEYSDYRINYEKIKENDGRTNRIKTIRFNFFSKRAERIQKDANKLFTLIKEYVEDFDTILSSIKKYLDLYEYKYCGFHINQVQI